MAVLFGVDDLRADALFRAGEPQSSTSTFWVKSLEYLNKVNRQLAIGGGIAVGRDLATVAGIYSQVVTIPMTDFWWLRKLGTLNTTAAITSLTATATQGSATVTLSSAPTVNVEGWRIQIASQPTVPKIKTLSGATITLDGNWPDDTQTTAACNIFQPVLNLPADFIRFASPPYVHSTFARSIPVAAGREQFQDNFPWAHTRQGRPTTAYQIGTRSILINTFDDRAYRLEFEYIGLPDELFAGGEPPMPIHQRSVLSSGAAMLILNDKNDSRAENLASEYREWVQRMMQEHRKGITGGSNTFGVFKVRSKGFIQRSPQPNGELFVV